MRHLASLASYTRRGFNLQVQGVEEDDQVLSLVVGQGDLLEGAIDDGHSLEVWGWLTNLGLRHFEAS